MLAAGAGWRTGETILGGTDYGPESDAMEAVKLCLERGADVNAADDDGLTALHHAVVRGSGVVRLLVEHGAALDAKDKQGRTNDLRERSLRKCRGSRTHAAPVALRTRPRANTHALRGLGVRSNLRDAPTERVNAG